MTMLSISTTALASTVDEPVTLAEANDWLGHPGNDAEVQAVLDSAVEEAEAFTRRTLRATTTRTITYDRWQHVFKMPFPPLQSISSVKYYNTADTPVLTTVTNTNYNVSTPTDGVGYFEFISTFVPPTLTSLRSDRIEIIAVTGWGSKANIPARIKVAIRHLVKYNFDGEKEPSNFQVSGRRSVETILDSLSFGFYG